MSALIHAVAIAVAVDADGPLAGALLLGPSGCGKSSLALAAVESCPYRRSALVADDQVLLDAAGETLVARAPPPLAGVIEIRGFGPAPIRAVGSIPVAAAFNLADSVERAPPPAAFRPIPGAVAIPLHDFLWKGAESTAPHRLRRIIAAARGGQTPQPIEDRRR